MHRTTWLLLFRIALALHDDDERRAWESANAAPYPGREYGGVDLQCTPRRLLDGTTRSQYVQELIKVAFGSKQQLKLLEIGPCAKYLSLPPESGVTIMHTVDVAESVASCSNARGYRPPTYLDDAQELTKVPSATYDIVVASHVLEHIANPLRALHAWMRVIKPGGLVIFFLPNPCYNVIMDRVRLAAPASHYVDEYRRAKAATHEVEQALGSTRFVRVMKAAQEDKAIQNFLDGHQQCPSCKDTSKPVGAELEMDAARLSNLRRVQVARSRLGHVHVWSRRTLREFAHAAEQEFSSPGAQLISSELAGLRQAADQPTMREFRARNRKQKQYDRQRDAFHVWLLENFGQPTEYRVAFRRPSGTDDLLAQRWQQHSIRTGRYIGAQRVAQPL